MKPQWNRQELTAAILIKTIKGKPQILMGTKTDGALKGYLNMPGGHIEETDAGPITASIRECGEETKLRCNGGRVVAILSIWRWKERKRVKVYIVHSPQFNGRVRRDPKEFRDLSWYPLDNIPYDKMAPKDDEWLPRVLQRIKRRTQGILHVCIRCGESRTDVRSVTLR